MPSVEIKWIDERVLRRHVDAYAAWLLAERPEVEEVVVFGSYERGDHAPGSDLDVFVVLAHAGGRVRDRVPRYLPGAFPVGLDLFPYTRAEMEARAPSPILDAMRASRWRYARPSGLR